MPIRKPRRQTLQELAYPPVPKIGGVDLRADEKILGIEDWEIGDRSRRYPTTQALSLLSASAPGSRWGSSAGGSSVAGWPVATSNAGSQASSGLSSPQKSSVTFPTNPTTHQVKRKAPPSLDPTTASSTVSSNPSSSPSKLGSPSKADTSVSSTSGSPPKRSFDGVVRPGDIVPPDWSPLTPAPSSTASRERRVSQPAPPPTSYRSLAAPQSSTHTRSRSHSQTLILAQTLPTIAASPRPTVDETPIESTKPLVPRSAPASPTKPIHVLAPTSPLRPVKNPALQPSSPSRPAGAQSTTSSSVSPRVAPAPSTLAPPSTIGAPPSQSSSSAPGPSFLKVPQMAPYGFTPPPASTVSAPTSAVSNLHSGSQVSASTQPRSVSRTLPRPPGPPAALPVAASLALSAARPTASAPVSPVTGPPNAAITSWRSGVLASGPGLWGTSYGSRAPLPPQTQPPPPPQPVATYESTAPQAHYQPAPLPTRTQYQPSVPQSQTEYSPTTHALLPASHNSAMMPTSAYPSAPNGGAYQGDVSPAGAPVKLTRKLTKSKSPSSSSTPRVIESNGSAFVSAQRALVGTHRPAQERIIWGLPLNRDPRVGEAIGKIEGMKDRLIIFGAEQFVQGRMRGAIMCNVDYHPPGYPSELAFDWITLKDAQKTLEPVLQKAIVQTDPATSVLVIVFLLSSSLNSLAIWRKCIPIPPGLLGRRLLYDVERAKREIASTERETVIKVCESEEPDVNREAPTEAVFPERSTGGLSRSGSTASRSRVLAKSRRSTTTPDTPSPLRWGRSKSP